MADYLSPGVYIEEVNTSGQLVQAVSTSTMAVVGWTERGMPNTPTLVGSVDDYQRNFGEYNNDSRVPVEVQAFFANGGTRAYVVRVCPTDAVAATSSMYTTISGASIGVGTGSGPLTVSVTSLASLPVKAGTAVLKWRNNPSGTIVGENPSFLPAEGEAIVGPSVTTLSSPPVVDGAININWTEAVQAISTLTMGTNPTASQTVTLNAKAYTFRAAISGASVDGDVLIGVSAAASLQNLYAAITLTSGAGVTYASAMTAHPTMSATFPTGTTMVVWAITGGIAGNSLTTTTTVTAATFTGAVLAGGVAAAARTTTLTGTSTLGSTARISSATINRTTGVLTLTFAPRVIGTTNGPTANSITVDYDPAGSIQTLTDNGSGVFTTTTLGSTVVSGTINYTTGATSVTFTSGTDLPYAGGAVTLDYQWAQWALAAQNVGTWGNRMLMTVSGNSNYFVYGPVGTANAGTYTKYNVSVAVQNTQTLVYEVKETYEEVVFNNTLDALYFPNVINDNSDFVKVTDLNALDIPSTFKGVAGTTVLGTGTGAQTAFTANLTTFPVVKASLLITYSPTDLSGTRTLVADVNGNITGTGLDTTKANTVNYTTGAIVLNFLATSNSPANLTAINASYIAAPTTSSVSYSFASGSNGASLVAGSTNFSRTQFTSPALAASKLGMYSLGRIDEVMQLIIPDFAGDTTVAGDQLDYAESRKDVFVILATPKGYSASQAADYKSVTFSRKSKYGAMYWPWITLTDPLNSQKTLTVPPLGHVAGVYARTDQNRNVGKAPGGTVDGALNFLTGLEYSPDKTDRDTVYQVRINPLINTTQTGLAVWGVRTMSPTNDVLRYINAVRLFQYVEKSTFSSTFGFVFESINSTLYAQIKTTVDSFLNNLFNTGHFAGNTPSQAYFVICDQTNNPPAVANQGQVIIDIGIAPNRPGEMIRFRFSQKTLTA